MVTHQPVQRHSKHLQPRNPRPIEYVRSTQRPHPLHQVHRAQKLVRRKLGRLSLRVFNYNIHQKVISFKARAGDSNAYVVLESELKLKVYKNFKERDGSGMREWGDCKTDKRGKNSSTIFDYRFGASREPGHVRSWNHGQRCCAGLHIFVQLKPFVFPSQLHWKRSPGG